MHAPHHVGKEWADRYRGQFDDGWDVYRERVFARQKELGIVPADTELSRHDPDVPEWDELPADQRRLYARMMEVFAGFLSHADHHIGRLLDYLRETGELDNTLVMLVSDNGASAEGGVTGTPNEAQFYNNAPQPVEEMVKQIDELGGTTTFNHYAWGWTFAGNTPFRRWKRETYRGGVSDPFIVHWPKGIKAQGELRTQYAHIIDLVPTVLDVQGIEPPATIRGVTQAPLHGISFRYSFDDAAAPARHRTQYFEMLGHRAIDHDGWRAVCPWPGPSFTEAGKPFGVPISASDLADLDANHWELYNVSPGTTTSSVPGPRECRSSQGPAFSTGPTPSLPMSRSPTRAGTTVSSSPRARASAAGRCTCPGAGCTTPTTISGRRSTKSSRRTQCLRDGTSCATSSSRPASWTSSMDAVPPAVPSCTSTASWSHRRSSRRRHLW
jgi:arylsulfatase A-like enzyme